MIKRNKKGQFIKGSDSPRYQAIFMKCPICGKKFKTIKSHLYFRKCCSHSCSIKNKHPRLGTGKYGIGRYLMKNGYFCIKIDGIKKYEHRHIMEQIIKRPIKRTESVHHIDENRQNNSPDNLILMDKRKHDSLHSSKRWKENKTFPFRKF